MTSTGLYSGGRELTPEEARSLSLPVAPQAPRRTTIRIPKYETGRMWTRDELVDLFRESWPDAHAGDVDSFVKLHFWDRVSSKPSDMIPFPPMPPIPDSVDDRDRAKLISDYEAHRSNTKRARELFAIDGLPMHVPSHHMPSENDSDHEHARKARLIESMA